MIAEYNLDIDPKELVALYRQCVKSMEDFFLIDVNSRNGETFRCGFEPIPRMIDEA
jgi:hypothetical protein